MLDSKPDPWLHNPNPTPMITLTPTAREISRKVLARKDAVARIFVCAVNHFREGKLHSRPIHKKRQAHRGFLRSAGEDSPNQDLELPILFDGFPVRQAAPPRPQVPQVCLAQVGEVFALANLAPFLGSRALGDDTPRC